MDQGLFDDSAVVRRVAREALLIAGGGRATVLQVAHPQIAQGTADHSGFAERPLSRLHHSMIYLYGVIFGSRAEAARVSRAVAAMHRRVTGPGYRADDPALQLWVAATLYDTAMLLHDAVLGPLPAADADECYQQYSVLATAIGCPASVWPASRTEFAGYWQDMVATLPVTDTARAVARELLFPRNLPLALRPAARLSRFVTVGLLPAPIRSRLGYSWTPGQERLLRTGLQATSAVYPRLPSALRQAPKTYYLTVIRKRVPARSRARA